MIPNESTPPPLPEPAAADAAARLQEKLARVPHDPGVYLMHDDAGSILYVGKAKDLRRRLSAYFARSGPMDVKTGLLIKKIADFKTILTSSEKEALILEANLIKEHRPRYNVILKDDKRYPSLRLNPREPYPRLTLVRKTVKDGALYFGPFASALAARQTLKFVNKYFKLRKCRTRQFKTRSRPCLYHQIQGCLAPCCLDISPADYEEIVREVALFLKGRAPELIGRVKAQMQAAADAQEYEKAAGLRDKMFALTQTLEKQVAVTTDFEDRDVIGLARSATLSVVAVLHIRAGYLVGTHDVSLGQTLADDEDILEAFVRQHYGQSPWVPPEIILPAGGLENIALLEEDLGQVKGSRVHIISPQRGEKLRLVKMARDNAANRLKEYLAAARQNTGLLERLRNRLQLRRLPVRIECFDNSNIGGEAAVSAMVVFEAGKARKEHYRRYRIAAPGPDDYAHMVEVLSRRYGKNEADTVWPDLLMVDGGKGQLGMAMAVLGQLGLEGRFDVVAIAKKDESRGEKQDKIFTPGRSKPVNLTRDADVLLFLQRIRDEAHRFAIAFHRRRRTRVGLQSVLDSVPGIGPRRKKMLLQHFGGLEKMRAATVDEIAALPGMNRKAALALRGHLQGPNKTAPEHR
jgi:excinuclease ABC subunit C